MPHTKIKPYPKNTLANLPDDQKAQLHAWLKSGIPYTQVAKKMLGEWGVKTWPNVLSRYYHRYVALELIEERHNALLITDEINREIKKKPADYAKVLVDVLGRKAQELSHNPETHPKIVKIWVDMYKGLRDQEIWERAIKLKERRLDLIEKQAAEARETVQNSTLTEAEIAERLRRIFRPPFNEPDEAQTIKNGNGFTV